MATQSEVERLKRVYAEYRKDDGKKRQWSGRLRGNKAIFTERDKRIKTILGKEGFLPLSNKRILDVGCGSGANLQTMLQLQAEPTNITGIDLLEDRIVEAKSAYPACTFFEANAEDLPFEENSFDIVMAFTVFTSILNDEMAKNIAKEIDRVLIPGGIVLWYDFRYDNPNNKNVRGVGKDTIRTLFPDYNMYLRSVTLLPPLARRLGRATAVAYPIFALIPLLRSHYIGVLRKQ